MRNRLKVIVGFISLFLITACQNDEDIFYMTCSDFSLSVVPLIYPYYAGSFQGGEKGPWYFSYHKSHEAFEAFEISSIDVVDSLIVGFYFHTWDVPAKLGDTTWHIINLKLPKQYRYGNYNDFRTQLIKLTLKQPRFKKPTDLWDEAYEKGYLPWFPAKYQNPNRLQILNRQWNYLFPLASPSFR